MAFGLIAAGIGAALNIAGELINADTNRKDNNRINNRITNIMSQVADYRSEAKTNIKNSQLQNTNRNLNVQASSGFEVSDFDRLNSYLQSENERELELFDKQTNLQLAEIEAGRPVQQSGFANALNIVNKGFGAFANLGGFGSSSSNASTSTNLFQNPTSNKLQLSSGAGNFLNTPYRR